MSKRSETIARNKAAAERLRAIHAENARIVEGGKCPHCGAGLRRNKALTGWYQCEQFGAQGFRKDSAKPDCGWQGFVDFPENRF